jgi:2',3'-cyclic-nucleotide 2'-phosphodiesterase (5'-nucleotidase family)
MRGEFMSLNFKHFVVFITILGLSSCKQESQTLSKIAGKQISIDSTFIADDSIASYITPYRNRVNTILDSTLAFAPHLITKEDKALNTTAGNLMADIILSESTPIFNSRTQKEIDFVVLNHGGIRSIISQGPVTARTAYQVMPFENTIAVVALSGKSVRDLISYLITSDRPHPISGLQIVLDKNDELVSVNVQGKPFDENRTYFVATSSYLVQGGDNMVFFKDGLEVVDLNYLIRNAMIDYFKKIDTLRAEIDDRFIKLNGS